MEKALKIDFTTKEYVDSEWMQVTVRGIKFAGEYDVDIYYARQFGSYVWETVKCEHVTCKRVSTINKRLAANGLTCKMD